MPGFFPLDDDGQISFETQVLEIRSITSAGIRTALTSSVTLMVVVVVVVVVVGGGVWFPLVL